MQVWKKLQWKDQTRAIVLRVPDEFEPRIAELEVALERKVSRRIGKLTEDVLFLAFVKSRREIEALALELAKRVEGDPIVWIAYPKKSSKRYRCEIDRDTGWQALGEARFEAVRQIALDEDWSALRFRRVDKIKKLTRAAERALSSEGKRRAR